MLSGEIALKNNHCYYYYHCELCGQFVTTSPETYNETINFWELLSISLCHNYVSEFTFSNIKSQNTLDLANI